MGLDDFAEIQKRRFFQHWDAFKEAIINKNPSELRRLWHMMDAMYKPVYLTYEEKKQIYIDYDLANDVIREHKEVSILGKKTIR